MVRAPLCSRPDANGETAFVRLLNRIFCKVGGSIARHPWQYAVVSTLITLLCSSIIPFTPMSNNVSDFTPTGARARKELANFEKFFSNKGEPIALYVLVTAKKQGNMLGLKQLEDTVKLLNTVSERFKVYNSATARNESFLDFCQNFCTINEPIRHFYSGLMIEKNFGNSSDHIDLGYPITTVLGRQLFMDPNFFGVKIAIATNPSSPDKMQTVSVNQLQSLNGRSILDAQKTTQLRNNIREIKLVGLQFRSERPDSISKESIKHWERAISDYVQREFKSDHVDAFVLSETILTDEVVRAGLTLLPFLAIGFSIMILFSCVTMGLAALYMSQMRFHKFLLAFVASCCPFMACGTTFGLLFWLGVRFGSILCVTPFLVLALGVDDAYLMLNSWQRLRRKKEKAFHHSFLARVTDGSTTSSSSSASCCSSAAVDERVEKLMEEVMIDTGASITITTLTNALAFAIGALTPTPEIQIFSVGNATAIIVVYIFVWTIFGAVMAIVGRWEMAEICRYEEECIEKGALQPGDDSTHYSALQVRGQADSSASTPRRNSLSGWMHCVQRWILSIASNLVKWYCRLLTNGFVAALVIAGLAVYVYISMYGLLNIKAELRPEQLFLKTSDVMKILELRNEFIIPFYAICFIIVNKPGNLSDPAQVKKLHRLVSEYESLPSSVGRFSTKFWLRDYEQFVLDNDGKVVDDLAAFETQVEGRALDERNKNEIRAFLEWPEFEHWKGFVRLENVSSKESVEDRRREVMITKFFFSTASYGPELKEWSKRGELLNEWRRVADMFPELEVSVYEDDAKFLDLIPTMISQTVQSSLATLFCMFLVCVLFMTHPTTVLVSNLAILSTCIGVFGLMSLWGADLDPILMSAAIMSIGFSVDIPAHISYHFYKTGLDRSPSGKKKSVEKRLRHCISAIGFPVLETVPCPIPGTVPKYRAVKAINMKSTPQNPKPRVQQIEARERVMCWCVRCGIYFGSARDLMTHFAGRKRYAKCPASSSYFKDGLAVTMDATLFNPAVEGLDDQWWRDLCGQIGDGPGHVYAYVREIDGVLFPVQFGYTENWHERASRNYKRLPGEDVVVVADKLEKSVGLALEADLISCIDLSLPVDERRTRNARYEHVNASELPQWLEQAVEEGLISRKAAYEFRRSQALLVLKKSLGDGAKRLSAATWMTPSMEAELNTSLSTPHRAEMKRRFTYTSAELPQEVGRGLKRYYGEGEKRGSLPAEERRSLVIDERGKVYTARTPEEQAEINELVEKLRANRSSSKAGLSTIVCVSSLLFVELHMAQIFARTLILVVAIGLVHGMLVIPVMLYLISLLPTHFGRGRLRPDDVKAPAPPPLPLTTTSSREGILTISLSADHHANRKVQSTLCSQ